MGFFDVMVRMIQGKPAFEAFDSEQKSAPREQQASSQPGNELVDSRGRKIVPSVALEHCKPHTNGKTMNVTVVAKNNSNLEIELDKIYLIGQKTEIDRRLRPGESHEIRVYKGPVQTNDNQYRANLVYKIVQNGDYFRGDYRIEYNRERDGSYTVEDFHPEAVVKDI